MKFALNWSKYYILVQSTILLSNIPVDRLCWLLLCGWLLQGWNAHTHIHTLSHSSNRKMIAGLNLNANQKDIGAYLILSRFFLAFFATSIALKLLGGAETTKLRIISIKCKIPCNQPTTI